MMTLMTSAIYLILSHSHGGHSTHSHPHHTTATTTGTLVSSAYIFHRIRHIGNSTQMSEYKVFETFKQYIENNNLPTPKEYVIDYIWTKPPVDCLLYKIKNKTSENNTDLYNIININNTIIIPNITEFAKECSPTPDYMIYCYNNEKPTNNMGKILILIVILAGLLFCLDNFSPFLKPCKKNQNNLY